LANWPPICENMTLSTKTEVHNILHCRQRMTEPRPHVTCAENLLKFRHAIFDICEQTKRHTDEQTTERHLEHVDLSTSPTYRGEVISTNTNTAQMHMVKLNSYHTNSLYIVGYKNVPLYFGL